MLIIDNNINLIRLITLTIFCSLFGMNIKIFGFPPFAVAVFTTYLFVLMKMITSRVYFKKSTNLMQRFMLIWFVSTIIFGIINNVTISDNLNPLLCILSMGLVCLVPLKLKDYLRIFNWINFGGIITLCVCLYEFITHNHLVSLPEDYIRAFGQNAFGFQINTNDNSTVLFILLFVAIMHLELSKNNGRHRFLLYAYIVTDVITMIMVGSRTAMLSLAILAFNMLFYRVIRLTANTSKNRILYGFLQIIIILTIVFVVNEIGLLDTVFKLFGEMDKSSDQYRMYLIGKGLVMAKENFFMGYGAQGFTNILRMNPHCNLLEMLCDYGIFTLISFLAVLVSMFKSKKYYIILNSFAIGFVSIGFASSSMIRIFFAWIVLAIFYYLGINNDVDFDDKKERQGFIRYKNSLRNKKKEVHKNKVL